MPPGPDADQPRTLAPGAGSPSAPHCDGSAVHAGPKPQSAMGAARPDRPVNSYPAGRSARMRSTRVGFTTGDGADGGGTGCGTVCGGAEWPHAADSTTAAQDARTRM